MHPTLPEKVNVGCASCAHLQNTLSFDKLPASVYKICQLWSTGPGIQTIVPFCMLQGKEKRVRVQGKGNSYLNSFYHQSLHDELRMRSSSLCYITCKVRRSPAYGAHNEEMRTGHRGMRNSSIIRLSGHAGYLLHRQSKSPVYYTVFA